MAAMSSFTLWLRPPEFSVTDTSHRSSATLLLGRRTSPFAAAVVVSPETCAAPPEVPEIHLEFIGPNAGAEGEYPVDRATAISGEKLLRNIMSDNKIELYAAYLNCISRENVKYSRWQKLDFIKKLLPHLVGKVMNCGGGGSCGTCIVEIIDGKELLNERTNTELRYLKKKPESWRLACQTIVGNNENSGKVIVQRLPQWKK